jgi:integrase
MAEKIVLTDRALKALRAAPPGKRVVTWDAVQPHLGIRVTENGAKSFIVVKRMAGVPAPVVHVLGAYPALQLIDARKNARTVLGQIVEGVNPKKHEKAKREEATRKGKDTFEAVAKDFIAKHISKSRNPVEAERVVNLYLVPTFGQRQVRDIKRREIAELLDDIERGAFQTKDGRKLGGPVMADHVLAALRKLLNWHAARDDDFASPIVKGMARTKPKERARDRTLTDDEIRALWATLDERDADAAKAAKTAGEKDGATDIFAGLVRTLLLTAQRREEVSQLARAEIDGAGLWTIPGERNKSKKPSLVPLNKDAVATIKAQAQVDDCDLVFTTNGKTPFSGFSKAKRQIDVVMLDKLRAVATERKDTAWLAKLNEIPKLWEAAANGDKKAQLKLKRLWWTLHDLRRTGKTLMARAGVRPDISERVLGHVLKGVEGVYDRHDYVAEKKEALEKLATMVTQIANPTTDRKVVPLRRKR